MLFALAVLLVLLLGAYVVWVLRQTMSSSCPNCAREGEDSPLIPIFFNFVWWCPSCNEVQQHRIVRRVRERIERDERDEERVEEPVDYDDSPQPPTLR